MPSQQTVEEQQSIQNSREAIESIMDSPTPPPIDLPPPPPSPPAPEAIVTKDPPPAVLPDEPEKLEEYLETFQPKTPNQQKAIPALKGHIKELHSRVGEKDKYIKELEEKAKSIEPYTPELRAEREELLQLRKAEDPAKDPEFQARYAAPLKEKDSQAITILKSHGLKDAVAEEIGKAGGLSVISRSSETVPKALGTDKTWAEWVEEVLLPNTPFADRKRLETMITESLNLSDQMSREVEDAKLHSTERAQAKFAKMGTEFTEGIQELVGSLGVMGQRWEANAGSSETEKATIDRHNSRLDRSIAQVKQFQSNLSNPREVGKMAAIAGQSVYLLESNADLAKANEELVQEVTSLKERIEKIKGSSSSARQTNAPPPDAAPETDKAKSARAAVENFFTSMDNE